MPTNVTATQRVYDHHIGALLRGDLDEILDDFFEDSVGLVPGRVVKGKQAIRDMFAGYLAGRLKPGIYQLEVDAHHIDGDIAYVAFHVKFAGQGRPRPTARDRSPAARNLAAAGRLRRDLDEARAADVLYTLSGSETRMSAEDRRIVDLLAVGADPVSHRLLTALIADPNAALAGLQATRLVQEVILEEARVGRVAS